MVQGIVDQCMKRDLLLNETYLQLVKQTTDHPGIYDVNMIFKLLHFKDIFFVATRTNLLPSNSLLILASHVLTTFWKEAWSLAKSKNIETECA